jgi:hypothetical protein
MYKKEDEITLKEEGFKKKWTVDKSGYWWEQKIQDKALEINVVAIWEDYYGGVIEVNKGRTDMEIYQNKKINLFLNKWRKLKQHYSE